MSTHWQAHVRFRPEGEMYFGVEADDITKAAEAADSRLAAFGLPVDEIRLEQVPVLASRSVVRGD